MIQIYRSHNGLWYWRIRARNGRIIADGSEGYVSRSNASRAFKRACDVIAECVG